MNIIAENIAHRRKELGITQKELAEKLNVSDKTLSRWETGKQIPDALTMLEIANALNMTINEIYGMEQKEENDFCAFIQPRKAIDYGRISTYKMILVISAVLFSLGAGFFNYTGIYWHSMKAGAMVLSIISLLALLISELTFEEFYGRKSQSEIYQEIHTRWFGSVVPVIGLLVGVVIPALKAPVITLFNSWYAMLPLILFQGIVLGIYTKRYLSEKEERIKTAKIARGYILVIIGILCSIGFIISVLSNPYRLLGGFEHDRQMEIIWRKLKIFEIAAGVSFFGMNVLFSIKKSGVFGKAFRKVLKITGAGSAGITMVIVVSIGIVNHNLQSKVSYVSGEVSISELGSHDGKILDWIQMCNLKGMEMNLLRDCIQNSETGEMTIRYLIYMPHGYKNTEFDIRYRIGLREKVLRIEAENTTQIADDNYYFGYVEIMDNAEDLEVQTFLDGESVEYGISGDLFETQTLLNGKSVIYGREGEP
ncbi:MAG: helix-turn-helix transcriptional regulator [Lachnospiraceae bacterium]|nr:helix-turn-helix transcriptional regulator [Lachnospiraceae bacterium]